MKADIKEAVRVVLLELIDSRTDHREPHEYRAWETPTIFNEVMMLAGAVRTDDKVFATANNPRFVSIFVHNQGYFSPSPTLLFLVAPYRDSRFFLGVGHVPPGDEGLSSRSCREVIVANLVPMPDKPQTCWRTFVA